MSCNYFVVAQVSFRGSEDYTRSVGPGPDLSGVFERLHNDDRRIDQNRLGQGNQAGIAQVQALISQGLLTILWKYYIL